MSNAWKRLEDAINRMEQSALREAYSELKAETTSKLAGLLVEVVRLEGEMREFLKGVDDE